MSIFFLPLNQNNRIFKRPIAPNPTIPPRFPGKTRHKTARKRKAYVFLSFTPAAPYTLILALIPVKNHNLP